MIVVPGLTKAPICPVWRRMQELDGDEHQIERGGVLAGSDGSHRKGPVSGGGDEA
jgi:hypothetical protein